MLARYIYSFVLFKCLFYPIMIDGDDGTLTFYSTLRVSLQLLWLCYYLHILCESLIYIFISTHMSAPRVVDKLVQWCFVDTSLYCTIIILYIYLLSVGHTLHVACDVTDYHLPFQCSSFFGGFLYSLWCSP